MNIGRNIDPAALAALQNVLSFQLLQSIVDRGSGYLKIATQLTRRWQLGIRSSLLGHLTKAGDDFSGLKLAASGGWTGHFHGIYYNFCFDFQLTCLFASPEGGGSPSPYRQVLRPWRRMRARMPPPNPSNTQVCDSGTAAAKYCELVESPVAKIVETPKLSNCTRVE